MTSAQAVARSPARSSARGEAMGAAAARSVTGRRVAGAGVAVWMTRCGRVGVVAREPATRDGAAAGRARCRACRAREVTRFAAGDEGVEAATRAAEEGMEAATGAGGRRAG